MKQREILLFDEQLALLKAYHEADFGDETDIDDLLAFFQEHSEIIFDMLFSLAKCFLFDDYYEAYREYTRKLLETTNA